MAENGSVVIKIKGDDNDFKSKLKSLGSAVSTTMKATAAAVGAASAGIAALGTACINAYAEYEQLTGGVETLFKDSAELVHSYADNAYKTAGMSANAYMETVTSFSASLLQSLGGDTEAAAKMADRAITDMADNANKMGTSMESIIQTYQSLSRGNFAMLDNLKLGYGGTKAELERLLKDAEDYKATMGEIVDYDINDFSDIVSAIGAIQDKMGITGTTAIEASTTIQGSIASMKASWTNLMVGMADDTQDFDILLSNFIESVGTVAENLLPRIGVVIEGMGKLVAGLAPEIAAALPTLTNELLPNLVELGVQAVGSLVEGIQENGDSLAEGALSIISTLGSGILELLPMIADTAASLIVSLADGITASLPEMVPAAVETIAALVENLTANADTILQAGIDIILALGQGIINAIPQLIEKIPEIVINIANVINDNAPRLMDAALYIITRFAAGLIHNIPVIAANIPKIIEAIVSAFMAFQWLNLGKQLITGIKNGITSMGESMKTAAKDTFAKFKEKFGLNEFKTELKNIGKNIIDGIVKGIKDGFSNLGKVAGEAKDFLLSKLKSAFKINSPSKLMRDEVGKSIGEGIAVGITESGQEAIDAAESVADGIVSAMAGTETAVDYARRTAQKVGDVLKSELSKNNAALKEMQKQADEIQAAEELEQHKKQLAEKHEELNKAEKKNKQKIQKEIADIEADWNRKQAKSAREAEQAALQDRISMLRQFQQEYESALSAIERKQEGLQSKLSDYGDLFERVKTEEGNELFKLGDIKDDIRQLEKYGEAIDKLKEKGISDGLLNEISGMGVKDAMDYMDKLISMSDTKFDQYVGLFEQKQQAAQSVAEKFYKNEFDALEQSYTGQLPAFLEGVKAEFSNVGAEVSEGMNEASAAGISAGMEEQEATVVENTQKLAEAAKEELAGYKDDFQTIGESLMEGVAQGVRDGQSGVVNAIARALRAAVRAAKEEMDINSPSRVMAEIGDYMAQGIGVGWSDRMETVSADIGESLSTGLERRMANAYERMKAAMQDGMQKLTGDIAVQARGATNYTTTTTTHQEGDTILQIEHFHNDSKEAIPSVMQEMEFARRRKALAKGGA